ncbi:OsmC family protein [Pseudomonadales bacterium]|nr:OsmC family protein [Pseudomonadales bacterium]
MKDLPHHYAITSELNNDGQVSLETNNAPKMVINAPPEFGGPAGNWSPETLLVASVASCFLLTFRALASASKLDWQSFLCDVSGRLDNVNKVLQFPEFTITANLIVDNPSDIEKAERLLKKSEDSCLIRNSLISKIILETHVCSDK